MPQPKSSTQCELIALTLVRQFDPPPRLVLTDSLCALQLIASWSRRPSSAILSCPERGWVRQFLHQWAGSSVVPTLEKVLAHDDAAAAAGDVKALGNTAVDALAKQAAAGCPSTASPDPRFADAVQLCDATGTWLVDVSAAVTAAWWAARCQEGAARRVWLATLYPSGLELDWHSSTLLFRRPRVEERAFVYPAALPVLKWVARARSGALNTGARLVTTRLRATPECLCCSASTEDDAHVVHGCPATGSADLSVLVHTLWEQACGKPGRAVLPAPWVNVHLPQLAVGLLPLSIRGLLPALERWEVSIILRNFHLNLCTRLAEVLRRREQLIAAKSPASSQPASTSGGFRPSPLALTVADLRAAESAPLSMSSAPSGPVDVPPGRLREQKQAAALSLGFWLKHHPHLQAVPLGQGEASVALLFLWEADHNTLYPCGKVDPPG